MQNGEEMHKEAHLSCTVMMFCIMNFSKIVVECTVLQATEFIIEFNALLEERVAGYDCIKVDFHDNLGTVSCQRSTMPTTYW